VKILFTKSIQDAYVGNSGNKNSGILRVCLLEKRTQCRKLDSFNKPLLIDYFQLRIAILQVRGSSGGQTWYGGHRVQMGGRAPLATLLTTAMIAWSGKSHVIISLI